MKQLKLILCVCAVLFFSNLQSQTVPAGFSTSLIGSGWTQPVGAAFSKDGKKAFIWEKAGKVFLCTWDNVTKQYVKQATPVVDISPEVGDWRDFGLLGFAIDPNFDNNGLIYLLYVVDRHYLMNFGTSTYSAASNDYFKATIGRVTRYKTAVNGSNVIADPASRNILLGETKSTGIPILMESHGVGSLVFAADGTLLVSAGDGASYNGDDYGSKSDTYYQQALTDGIIRPEENVGSYRSQMINSLNGKILRLDPTNGNGLSNNPFYLAGSPRAARSRVWALGFRNPFRITFKPNSGSTNPSTGDLGEIYVGDVGYGTYEEMNIIDKPGMNFGWPLFEGHTPVEGYYSKAKTVENKDELNPLFGGGCTQKYFYFGNLIKQATADNNTTVYNPCNGSQPIASSNSNRFFHARPAIDWKHQEFPPDSARIGIFNGNNAGIAQIGSPQSGVAGVPFHGNCTVGGVWITGPTYPPAYINTFFFGEGVNNWVKVAKMKNATEIESVSNFASGFNGLVAVTQNPMDGSLVCVDYWGPAPDGARIIRISYGGSLPPVAKITADKIYGPSSLAVNLSGSNSKDPEGGALTYLWNFGDATTSTQMNPAAHNFTAPANTPKKYVVKLTVTDNMNLQSTDSITISVNNTPPVVNIVSPVKNSKYLTGRPQNDTIYTLQANVADAEHSDQQLKYAWQTVLRHNTHEHAEPIDANHVTSTVISRVGCNGDTYYYLVRLTVTDEAGLSTTDSSRIFPLCPGDVILPVKLSSFSVNTENNINVVKWTTEEEVNSKYFEIERSSNNGQNFITIDQQPAKNLPGIQQYVFADASYSQATNYYRLKITDLDGSYTYSSIIKVFNGGGINGDLRITPNPVSKEFTLSTSFPASGPVKIRITDVSGKLVKQINDNVNSGNITMQVYQLEKLSSGTYFIEVIQRDYSRKAKFVKVD